MPLFRFSNHRRGATLHYPLKPMPRIAVFDERFQKTGTVSVFREAEVLKLEMHRMETAAASLPILRVIRTFCWRPQYPLIVFSPEEALLTDADRDELWRAFQVPVFEQLLGREAELKASECEAHNGFHLYGEADLRLRGMRSTETLCACGRSGLRLESFVPESAMARSA